MCQTVSLLPMLLRGAERAVVDRCPAYAWSILDDKSLGRAELLARRHLRIDLSQSTHYPPSSVCWASICCVQQWREPTGPGTPEEPGRTRVDRWRLHRLSVFLGHLCLSTIYLKRTSMTRTEEPHLTPGPGGSDWELTAVTQGDLKEAGWGGAVTEGCRPAASASSAQNSPYCTRPWAWPSPFPPPQNSPGHQGKPRE